MPITLGSVAITFDDNNIDNWFEYLPLLDSLGIRATFYICRYHEFSARQKQELTALAANGHEIGYHTTHHLDLAKLTSRKGLSYAVDEEIKKDLAKMKEDGFNPVDFAYPFGSHTPELDVALQRCFKTVRAVSNRQDWHSCLIKSTGDDVLHGAGIDNNSELTDEDILEILDRASASADCSVFTGHKIISTKTPFHVSLSRLAFICREVAKRNLHFVTIEEITH